MPHYFCLTEVTTFRDLEPSTASGALLRGFPVMFLQNSFLKIELQLAWASVSSAEMSLHITLQASCCNMKMSL